MHYIAQGRSMVDLQRVKRERLDQVRKAYASGQRDGNIKVSLSAEKAQDRAKDYGLAY